MPRRRITLLAGLLIGLLVLAGCSEDTPDATPRDPSPTALAQLDAGGMRIVRVGFCDLVPDDAVTAALGTEPTADSSWGNGDPVPGATGSDIAHELGCAWTARGVSARAWVFARPVSTAFAATLVRSASRQRGCKVVTDPRFGSPALAQTCRYAGGLRVRHAGLFADTWLTCEISGRGTATVVRLRADGWCAAVASALDAG